MSCHVMFMLTFRINDIFDLKVDEESLDLRAKAARAGAAVSEHIASGFGHAVRRFSRLLFLLSHYTSSNYRI